MLVNFISMLWKLVCSAWKHVLHASISQEVPDNALVPVIEQPHYSVLLCVSSLHCGVPVSSTVTFRCGGVYFLMLLA